MVSEDKFAESDRVFTAKLPAELASKLDDVASRLDRSRSWIIRQAVAEWLSEEERRYQLTLEAMGSMDAGMSLSAKEVATHFTKKRSARFGSKR